jgi:sialate O-acetylesterase
VKNANRITFLSTSLLLFISFFSLSLQAQVRPASIFDNNMVLQRDKPVKVWGQADPREAIKIEFAGQNKTTMANEAGEWSTYLDIMPANAEPQDMKVSGKKSTVKFTNVLIGDIWILGGQSNMEFDLARIYHGDTEILSANFPKIRHMTIPSSANKKPQKDFDRINEYDGWYERYDKKGSWFITTPETVPTLSGIGYVFARRIYMASQVPIGLVDVSMGGTTLEAWLKPESLNEMPENSALMKQWNDKAAAFDPAENLKTQINNWEKRTATRIKNGQEPNPKPDKPSHSPAVDRSFPGSSYTGMVAVVAGLTVKGVLFHHGYNNALEDSRPKLYELNFKTLINDWRETFEDKALPFGIIDLSAGGEPQTLENFEARMVDAAPYIREGQFNAFKEMPNTGFVASHDQQVNWYHPQKKVQLAERMARWAMSTQYGFDVEWEPAVHENIEVLKDKIVVTFNKKVKSSDDRPIEGFSIAGSDGRFYPAKAKFVEIQAAGERPVYDRTSIEVWNEQCVDPIAIRYAWARNPLGNLVNDNARMVPVPLFRTDNWDYPEAPYLADEYAAHRLRMRSLRQEAKDLDAARIKAEGN